MIVKNEREHLGRCLSSVKEIVDEMIVVDTGSTDGTQEIAREHGATLIQSTWENDFARARNRSLAEARGDWILVLDADEFIPPGEETALRALLTRETPAAFNLVVQCSSDGGLTGMLVHIVRLFPNRPDVRYEWPVHEQVMTSLARARVPVVNATVRVVHTGYSDRETNRRKQIRNREILQAQLDREHEVSPMTFFLLEGCLLDLGETEAALKRYREAERVAQETNTAGEVARGAHVRQVTCLLKLGRAEEAIAAMPTAYQESWHPELVAHRAEAEARCGRAEEARSWHERVFACADTPQIPPYDLAQLKSEALLFLATYWRERGRPALGVKLLRTALAIRQEGRAFGPKELAACYAAD